MTWNQARKLIGAQRAYKYIRDADLAGRGQVYLLDRLGLERKNPTATLVGGIGFFALGMLVGSALGVMLAPMSGTEIRTTMREQGMKGVVDRTRASMPATPSA
jgi:hypothetical protein